MVDHVTHYVHDILARFLADTLHLTRLFPFLTANFVSFTGLLLALIGCRLTLSDNYSYRQIGALLFEARNLADSLDGVVYRSRIRDEILLNNQKNTPIINTTNNNKIMTSPQLGVYQSFYGTFGYNVDVICDGLAGLFFVIAMFIRFLKHPPSKFNYFNSNNNNNNSKIELNSNNEYNNNYSNYEYHRLDKMISSEINNNDNNFIQMDDDLNNNISDETEPNKLLIERKSPTSIAAAAAFASPSNVNTNTSNNRHYSTRELRYIVFYFGIRILFTGLIWDHYVHKYHDLLMVFSNNPIKRVFRFNLFKLLNLLKSFLKMNRNFKVKLSNQLVCG